MTQWLPPFEQLKKDLADAGLDKDPCIQKAINQYEKQTDELAEKFIQQQRAAREARKR